MKVTKMTGRVGIAGATRWVGSLLARTILSSREFQRIGVIARKAAGQDIGLFLGLPAAFFSARPIINQMGSILPDSPIPAHCRAV